MAAQPHKMGCAGSRTDGLKGGGDMKEKLLRLLGIKNLVTLILTVVFAAITLLGWVEPEKFLMIFASVTAFYFSAAEKDEK